MLILSIPLTIVTMVMVGIMVFCSKKSAGQSGAYFAKQQKDLGTVNGYIEEMMNGQKVVKVFCHEEENMQNFKKLNDELYISADRANTFANFLGPINAQIGNISYVICAIVGGVLALGKVGGFTLGGLASFLTFNKSFSMPINQISMQMNAIVMAMAGADRIFRLMDEKEEKLYRQMEKDMLLPFEDGDVDAVNAAALSGKLLQMANGAVYDENHKVRHIHDKKLDALEDLIEAANGKPVLVAYWYQHDLDRIVERFKAVPLKAAGDIRKWKEGKIPVAAIHPASAGHGLNIQDGGHILIWFGLTWSLELYMQCNARLWRQGQRETVMIYHIINKGTLDEDAMRSLEQKDCGQSAIIDAVKARIGGVNGASRKDD